jgi:putative iron-dependent peroxidase
MSAQPGILLPPPRRARYLSFAAQPDGDVRAALHALQAHADGEQVVLGLGRAALLALGRDVEGLRELPVLDGPGIAVPSTPAALWLWLRGDDAGVLLHRARQLEAAAARGFALQAAVEAFSHLDSRDLTGFEDGTENPKGEKAELAALVHGRGPGLDGSSFAAVQQWVHDFARFESLTAEQQNAAVGRHKQTNAELPDAPASSHVKRTAQESFSPEAFVLRRSMPWTAGMSGGLMFVAFGRSLDAFEAQLRRMAGHDDGITDALFGFTRPVSGASFWCPPMRGGAVDLSALGL